MGYSSKNLHIDQALTNISVGYRPTGFIADIVAPVIKVQKESDKFYVWNREDAFRSYDDILAPGAEARAIDFTLSNDSYFAEEYGLKTRIVWRDLDNADSVLKLEMNKTRKLKDTLLVGREKRVATLFTTLATFAAGLSTTYSGVSQWNNGSYVGDPILEIDNAKEAVRLACGFYPNVIIIGAAVVPVLTNNAKYREHYKYTAADVAGNGLPPVLRGMKVLVPGAINTTSNEGAASPTTADLWGKNLILAYVNLNNEPMTDDFSLAYTFRSQDYQTRKYNVDAQRSQYIETTNLEAVKIVSNVAGYLIKAVIN